MDRNIRIRMAAGPRALPWAERLAQEWRLAGLEVSCAGATSGDDDWVRIEPGNDQAVAELFLDRRKIDFTGPYLCIEVAGDLLEAGGPVDFGDLADQTSAFIGDWSLDDPSSPKRRNSWADLVRWLEVENGLAAVVLLWHVAENYPYSDYAYRDQLEKSLLRSGDAAPAWLLRNEARRLILRTRYVLFEQLELLPARELLRRAALLCKRIGDSGLAARVEALRAMAAVEEHASHYEKALARLHRAWRRAEKLGDWPAAFDIGETIVRLHGWRRENAEALRTLEMLADLAARAGAWSPPRLGHLLRLYRMLLEPSQETASPWIEELKALLARGDSTWMFSLDHLDRLRGAVGKKRFVALVGASLGPANARRLADVTRYGRCEDQERREELELREKRRKREREPMDPLRWQPPWG